ncbi:transposase [Vibrio ostreae]|uniref:Transposase n=1 Tax=Vibrio ostreae TaxID=2841925 RepID=A0A975YN07_9VIBR|nr:transposase [Vibrio ostreae]QXO17026.1 transposase [Vibrio ostreae]
MTTARSQLICPDITPYYHCVSRCVRRSYLCGEDSHTGQSYQHRRAWVEERILTLATIYCIDICAYAVMSNHYHLVAFIDMDGVAGLSDSDVIERWGIEHCLPRLIQRYQSGQKLAAAEWQKCREIIEVWRSRLCSLSWFMKELNYQIARQANQEDQCTGRFWEGRFKSQALLDDKALLAAMAYADLNPVRAKVADTPEQSDHTSVKARLVALDRGKTSARALLDFIGYHSQEKKRGIPFRLMDYLELLDWLGRQMREGKRGVLDESAPGILQRLSLVQKECLTLCSELEKRPRAWVGSQRHLMHAKSQLNRQRMLGIVIS